MQSIPAVFVAQQGKVVPGVHRRPARVRRPAVRRRRCCRREEDDELAALVEAGDEESLRKALELDPATTRRRSSPWPSCSSRSGEPTPRRRWRCSSGSPRPPRPAASPRWPAIGADGAAVVDDGVEAKLDALLDRVKDDEDARQEFVDVLELLGPDDERTSQYRRKLTSRLF